MKREGGWFCRCGLFLDANRDVARDMMNAHRIDVRAVVEACEQCGAPAPYRNPSLCTKHYQRWRAHGDFYLHTPQAAVCVEPGCTQPNKAYGYCAKHWRRVKAHADAEDRKWSHRGSDRCSVPGCGGAHRSMGLCRKHYQAEQRRGHPVWRTLGRQKVHRDRPWNPDSVVDPGRLLEGYGAGLTAVPSSSQQTAEHVGEVTVNDPIEATDLGPQTCQQCQQDVVPVLCGERNGQEICTDLLCPSCGEELEVQASA